MNIARAKSKVEYVQDAIREMVYSGDLSAGQRLPTESQMAEQFGVSTVTINRAMSSLESTNLVKRAPGLGTYVRQDVVRGTVVVVMPMELVNGREGSPFFGAMMNKLISVFAAHNMRAQFVVSAGDTNEEFLMSLHPHSPLWSQARLVVGLSVPIKLLREKLVGPEIPVVHCASELLEDDPGPCVILDYFDMGKSSCQHLIEREYHRIGILYPYSDNCTSPALAGMTSAMNAAGLPVRKELCEGLPIPPGEKEIQEIMWRLWSQPERPDALIVCDDSAAVNVGKAINQMGIKTPEELAIITHATTEVDIVFPLPFTTCQFSLERICKAIYGLVDRKQQLQDSDKRAVWIHPHVVKGETT